jgi:hypothetical protein
MVETQEIGQPTLYVRNEVAKKLRQRRSIRVLWWVVVKADSGKRGKTI